MLIPLYTLLGVHLGADPSQVLAVRCLGEKIRIEVIYRDFSKWVETDVLPTSGVSGNGYRVGSETTVPSNSAAFVLESGIFLEGVHVEESEVMEKEALHRGAFQQYFAESQYVSSATVAFGTTMNGATTTIRLDEVTQPVSALYIMCRWKNDLERIHADPYGTYGYCPFNVGGWYSAGGTQLPLFEYAEIRTGSNNNVLKRVRVEQILWLEHARAFRGSPNVAVMKISFSHDPSRENAVLGYMDFSGLDKPVLSLTTRTNSTYTTVGALANLDIGTTSTTSLSDLQIDVIAKTVNQINFANGQMKHLIN